MRGYAEESLGPHDPVTGVPSGGDRLVILNQEARLQMFKWVNGVVFVTFDIAFDVIMPKGPLEQMLGR